MTSEQKTAGADGAGRSADIRPGMDIPKPKYDIGDKAWAVGFETLADPDATDTFEHTRIPVPVKIERVMIFRNYKDSQWFVEYEVAACSRHGCCLGFGFNPRCKEVLIKFLENRFEMSLYDTEDEAVKAIKDDDDLPF